MDGTDPGGVDRLAHEPSSGDASLATPMAPPISDADQRQRDEERSKFQRLVEWFDSTSPAEAPEPQPYCENELLPSGWEWREGESGIVLPVAPPPDPNDRRIVFVRFLDHFTETGGRDRKFAPGDIVKMEQGMARELLEMRRFGFLPESWPASVEYATEAEFKFQEALIPEVAKNEKVTAQDELSQELARKDDSDDSGGPKLIVRFLPLGNYGNRECSIGEVRPVPKERALRLLRCKVPVVELATPDDLKRDWDLVNQIREAKKRSDILGESQRFFIRFRKRGKHPKGHTCEPGEVWEVDENHAHSLCRGRSPVCELATEAELKAYRASLTREPAADEPAEQGQTGTGGKTVKPKKSTGKGGQRLKAIAALSTHHQYDDGDRLNFEPIGIGKLALLAGVSKGTVSNLYWEVFDGEEGSSNGFVKYKRACHLKHPLIEKLKSLNGDIRPRRHRSIRNESSLADESHLDDE